MVTTIFRMVFVALILFPLTVFSDPSQNQSSNESQTKLLNKVSRSLAIQNLSGRLNEGSCTDTLCIAVGYANNKGQYPLLLVSTDSGNTFNVNSNITNFKNLGTLLTASCTGSGNTAVCIAGGYLGASQKMSIPYLIQSIDGGATWQQITVSSLLDFGLFKKVSCTGNSPSTTCIAVGWGNEDRTSNTFPILAQSLDNGKTWFSKPILNLSPGSKGQLYAASCTGQGVNAMCVAVGNYTPYATMIPLLAQTSDGGSTWINTKYLFLSTMSLTFTDVNCTGGSNAICTIAGRVGTSDPLFNPIIYQTTDRGANWIKNPLQAFPVAWNGTANAIHCAGDANNPVCATVGVSSFKPALLKKVKNAISFPLIMQNSGNQWSIPSINNAASDWNTLYDTTCVTGTNNFCFAVGYAATLTNPRPVLATTSTANNWQAVSINAIPSQGLLSSTSCNAAGSTCIAVGYSQGTADQPLIVSSNDSGKTWNTILNISTYCSISNNQLTMRLVSGNQQALLSVFYANSDTEADCFAGPPRPYKVNGNQLTAAGIQGTFSADFNTVTISEPWNWTGDWSTASCIYNPPDPCAQ